jgi:hypothetical protein
MIKFGGSEHWWLRMSMYVKAFFSMGSKAEVD